MRTTASLVKAVLLDDYGPRADGAPADLQGFIDAASAVVSRVERCATRKGLSLTTAELELVERWLAAHLYCQADKPETSRSTGGASAPFMASPPGPGFAGTVYGQTAMRIDYSGCLRNFDSQQRAGATWLGRAPAEQTPWWQR